MAAKRIDIMDLRQLLQLKHKGISNRKIVDLLGINRNTVNDYIRVFNQHAMSHQQLLECSDQDLHDLFPTVDTVKDHEYSPPWVNSIPHLSSELSDSILVVISY